MEKKYKITEIATLFGTTRKTLIYYDEIDLFKPSFIDPDNSYRYYASKQFYKLRLILLLKKTGFSLNEIRIYINSKSPEESLTLITGKTERLKKKIEFLLESQLFLNKQIEDLQFMVSDKSSPKIVVLEEKRVFSIPLKNTSNEKENSLVYDEVFRISRDLGIMETNFFGKLKYVEIIKKNFMNVDCFGFEVPNSKPRIPGEKIHQGGKFAYLPHKGIWNNIDKSYKELLFFIEENNYKVNGDSIEKFVDHYLQLDGKEGGIVHIYIPIVERNQSWIVNLNQKF